MALLAQAHKEQGPGRPPFEMVASPGPVRAEKCSELTIRGSFAGILCYNNAR